MIRTEIYTAEHLATWNQFVGNAKNGHFMFQRSYMDYHADRFNDHSLLLFKDDKLVALLPSNKTEKDWISHQGLTFGGFLTSNNMNQALMMDCMEATLSHGREQGFEKLIYKAIPFIYATNPAQEDLYALFRNEAKLFRRDVSSTVQLSRRIKYRTLKKRGLKKAKAAEVRVEPMPLDQFWPILEQVLEAQHGTKPVHSLAEITMLAERFPKNIQCRGGYLGDEPLAGILLFINGPVVHTQYIAAAENGRTISALDYVIDQTIEEFARLDFEFFNFGISTEEGGQVLNEGLIFHKEGFGARSVCHDHLEITL